jgi:hypothetical protein
MGDSDLKSRLNLRDGGEIRECSSFDEAVLWCYRHDSGALGVGPQWSGDPDFEAKLGFALPHLEDYLRLILKQAESFDIPAYARSLHARMIAESDRIERYSDGEFVWDSWEAYYKRFRAPDFVPGAREMEVSIYPFPSFEIDLEELAANPPKLRDPRCEYLADMFRKHFPSFCADAGSVRYPSHSDHMYSLHADAVILAMRHFFFTNPVVPRTTEYALDRGLWGLKSGAAIAVRPKVVGEDF